MYNIPQPKGAYTDMEALALLQQYREDPSDLSCPHCCVPRTMEVLAFIAPEIEPGGFAEVVAPEGDYAAAVYCHACQHAIGICPNAKREEEDKPF